MGEFENVSLTSDEYSKLCEKNAKDRLDEAIEILSAYLKRTGKRYKSHYACLKGDSWVWGKVKAIACVPAAGEVSASDVRLWLPTSEGEIPITHKQIEEWESMFPNCAVVETLETEMLAKLRVAPKTKSEALQWCINRMVSWNEDGRK